MLSFSSSGKSAGTIPDVSMLFTSSRNPAFTTCMYMYVHVHMYKH